MASKMLTDLETLFAPGYLDSEDKFEAFCNIDDMCRDLGFDIFDLTFDPVLTDHREKRDQLKVGDTFNSLRDFKDAVIDLAIDQKWEPRVVVSNKSHVRMTCWFQNDCEWRARCNWNPLIEEAKISVWHGEHTCWDKIKENRPLVARQSYLLELIPKLMTIDRKTPIATIQDQVLRNTEILVKERLLYKVKSLLTEDTSSQQIEDFAKLPIWLKRLQKENQNEDGSCDLQTDLLLTEDHIFRRVFIGPHTARAQWVHSMPFIALDGTYLRNCFKQTLLLAVGRNGNNESWIIAFAIVESENDESWDWFIERLCRILPELKDWNLYLRPQAPLLLEDPPCLISDRNSSLLKAIENHLPKTTDVYCCWHLLKNVLNITKHVNKKAIREAWWPFVFAKNQPDWDRAVREMKKVGGQEAVDYIEALDKTKFSAWKLPGSRYGHNSSGIVESQNGHIRELREMGIMELLDALWTRTSRKRQITYEKAVEWMDQRDRYTPFARKKIMANTLWSRKGVQRAVITAHRPGEKTLEAKVRCQYDGIGDRTHVVRCQDFFCSCGQFQEWRLPCSHAITAIRFAGREVYEWVAPFWEPWMVATGNAYRTHDGGEILLHMRTIKTDDIKPESYDDECKAPPMKPKKTGLNQKKRKETGDKPEVAFQQQSCGRCGRAGHNKRNKKECPAWRES